MCLLERRISEEHVAPDDLAGEDKVGFALYLFLQVAQDNAIFLFHRGIHGVAVIGTDLLIDVESCCSEDSTLPSLSAYQFPCFFRVLQFHENFNRGICNHLLRSFLVSFQNTGVIL